MRRYGWFARPESAPDPLDQGVPMTTSQTVPNEPSAVLPVGSFSWEVADDRWQWSPGTYRLHGYDPDEIQPSTAVTLNHKHPDDVQRWVDGLHAGILTGEPIVCEHRLLDIHGEARPVVAVAMARRSDGEVSSVQGCLIGVDTERWTAETPDELGRAETSAMLGLGLSEPAARALVDWYRDGADDTAAEEEDLRRALAPWLATEVDGEPAAQL
jgi:hypothetical protein